MGVSIEAELSVLEKSINALRIDYERFFTGDVKLPPLAQRRKLETMLRQLANMEVDRAADRFRLQGLQSRYNSMTELWEKRLIAKEEGRLAHGVVLLRAPKEAPKPVELAGSRAAAPNAPAPASVEKRRIDFTPLFQRYVEARQALGEDVSRLRYERFEELVKKQADEIRKRTGSSRLVFEVQTVDGKVKLIGRPGAAKGKG